MSVKLVYVKFKDRVKAVVEIDDVADFLPRHSKDFDSKKLYNVKWQMQNGEKEDRPASILCLAASRDDLISTVTNMKLPQLPPSFLKDKDAISDVPDSALDSNEEIARGRKRTRQMAEKASQSRSSRIIDLARKKLDAVSSRKIAQSSNPSETETSSSKKLLETRPSALCSSSAEQGSKQTNRNNLPKRNLLSSGDLDWSSSSDDDSLIPKTDLKILKTENASLVKRLEVLEKRRSKAVEDLNKVESELDSARNELQVTKKQLVDSEARNIKLQHLLFSRPLAGVLNKEKETTAAAGHGESIDSNKDGNSMEFSFNYEDLASKDDLLDSGCNFMNDNSEEIGDVPFLFNSSGPPSPNIAGKSTTLTSDEGTLVSSPIKTSSVILNPSTKRTPAKKTPSKKLQTSAKKTPNKKLQTPAKKTPNKKLRTPAKETTTKTPKKKTPSKKKGNTNAPQWSVSNSRIKSLADVMAPEFKEAESKLPVDKDSKVSISKDLIFHRDVWDTIRKSKTESKLVTNALRSLWPRKVLGLRSLKGQVSNRQKNQVVKPPLTPKKVEAVYAMVQAYLMKEGITVEPKLSDMVKKTGTSLIQKSLGEEHRWLSKQLDSQDDCDNPDKDV